jgi:hypothetical protein
MWDVTFPNGRTLRLPQTDVGPSQDPKKTGGVLRGIDVNAVAAQQAGYTPGSFPTNGQFTYRPAQGGGGQVASLTRPVAASQAQSGVPVPAVQQANQVANQAAVNFIPGQTTMKQLAAKIDQADVPPIIKFLALAQASKMLQPSDQMMFRALAMQNQDQVRLAITEMQQAGAGAREAARETAAGALEAEKEKGRGTLEAEKEKGRQARQTAAEQSRADLQAKRLAAAQTKADQINERIDRHFEQNQARLKGNEKVLEDYRKAMLNLNSLRAEQDPLNPDPKITAEIEQGRQRINQLWQNNSSVLPAPSAVMGSDMQPQAAPPATAAPPGSAPGPQQQDLRPPIR